MRPKTMTYRRFDWRSKRAWKLLLFEPGQGWFRWGRDEREYAEHHGEGLTEWLPCSVAPPARCFAWWLAGWVTIPLTIIRFRRSGWGWLSWEEYRPERLRDVLASCKSDDRPGELSNYRGFYKSVHRGRDRFRSQHPGAA
jgi:hypothetical protein